MKHWPSHFFPVILLATMAALSFWLQKSVEMEGSPRDGKLRHDPDTIAENFEARRFDLNGEIKYRLSGPQLIHYPDDDTSLLQSPTLITYRKDAPPLTLTGDHAKVSAKGETVFLWDKVRAERAATEERPAMLARMNDLTIQPNNGFAFTNSPVEITQGQSWLKGIGAELDNNASTMLLRSQVTGMYIRPQVKP